MTDTVLESLEPRLRWIQHCWSSPAWIMTVRVLLAVVGCYVLAASVAMALARALPIVLSMPRLDAAAAATIFGMALWPCSVVAVFAYNSVIRISVVIGAVTALCALIAWLAGQPL